MFAVCKVEQHCRCLRNHPYIRTKLENQPRGAKGILHVLAATFKRCSLVLGAVSNRHTFRTLKPETRRRSGMILLELPGKVLRSARIARLLGIKLEVANGYNLSIE